MPCRGNAGADTSGGAAGRGGRRVGVGGTACPVARPGQAHGRHLRGDRGQPVLRAAAAALHRRLTARQPGQRRAPGHARAARLRGRAAVHRAGRRHHAPPPAADRAARVLRRHAGGRRARPQPGRARRGRRAVLRHVRGRPDAGPLRGDAGERQRAQPGDRHAHGRAADRHPAVPYLRRRGRRVRRLAHGLRHRRRVDGAHRGHAAPRPARSRLRSSRSATGSSCAACSTSPAPSRRCAGGR